MRVRVRVVSTYRATTFTTIVGGSKVSSYETVDGMTAT